MDMLIILTYTSICIAIFKLFKIPLNKWSVPTAVLGGIIILSAIMLIMNYNHPYAKYAKEIFISIPIVPEITGTVATVDVEPNVQVKEGTTLFTLRSTQQRIMLAQAQAAYEEAKNEVLQNDETLIAATANVKKAQAEYDRSKLLYNRGITANKNAGDHAAPYSQHEIDSAYNLYIQAEGELSEAKSDQRRERLVTESTILGEDTNVAQLRATRDKAQLDFDRTVIKAPMDGMPTQIGVRPGIRATALPLAPVMTFIPKEKRRIAGVFFQNSLLRLKEGLDAEVVLDAVPGHVFTGKVRQIIPAMSEGQVQAFGRLLPASILAQHGFVIVIVELDEDLDDYNLPLGVQGQIATFNYEYDYIHVSIVRRILLRMMSWLNYVYPMK